MSRLALEQHDLMGAAVQRREMAPPGRAPVVAHPMLQLQQVWGNRRVQRLVDDPATLQDAARGAETQPAQARDLSGVLPDNGDGKTAEAPPTTEGNPLVGLTRGDGLDYGTWERRPRVKLLQTKLNEKMLAGLNVDGMFGPKTDGVLQEYQASIRVPPQSIVDTVTADALMDRKKAEKQPEK